MGPPSSSERSADSASAMAAMAAAASAAYVRPKKPLLARPLIHADGAAERGVPELKFRLISPSIGGTSSWHPLVKTPSSQIVNCSLTTALI